MPTSTEDQDHLFMTSSPQDELPSRFGVGRGVSVLLGLTVIGIAVMVWLVRDKAMTIPPAATQPVPAQVATAKREDVPVYLTGLGTVQAFNTVTVRARVDGELQQVLFTEGQLVKKGDLLAVDRSASVPGGARPGRRQGRSRTRPISPTRSSCWTGMRSSGQAISPASDHGHQRSTVEQLQAQLAQDQAAKDDAAMQLSYTQLTAPLDGRTGIRLVDQGNIVHATDSTGLVVITQTQPISSSPPCRRTIFRRAGRAAGRPRARHGLDDGRRHQISAAARSR